MSEYVKIEIEATENPDIVEIITNQVLTEAEKEVYASPQAMEMGSVLSQALFFAVDGMAELVITPDSLIVTRAPNMPWEMLIDEIRDALRDYYL